MRLQLNASVIRTTEAIYMRECLFCERSADSVEDVWPNWIMRQYSDRGATMVHAERGSAAPTTWRLRRPELRIRCVCHVCNNGWMSRLEGDTIPYLQPLLDGKAHSISPNAQASIALWAVKTAMIVEMLEGDDRCDYKKTERRQLSLLSAIPERTRVWVAPTTDPSTLLATKTRHEAGGPAPISAVVTTISLAHVALQVFSLRDAPPIPSDTQVTVSIRRGPWEDLAVQVWPPEETSLGWPTKLGLNGEVGLDEFAGRFSVAAQDVADVQIQAV